MCVGFTTWGHAAASFFCTLKLRIIGLFFKTSGVWFYQEALDTSRFFFRFFFTYSESWLWCFLHLQIMTGSLPTQRWVDMILREVLLGLPTRTQSIGLACGPCQRVLRLDWSASVCLVSCLQSPSVVNHARSAWRHVFTQAQSLQCQELPLNIPCCQFITCGFSLKPPSSRICWVPTSSQTY